MLRISRRVGSEIARNTKSRRFGVMETIRLPIKVTKRFPSVKQFSAEFLKPSSDDHDRPEKRSGRIPYVAMEPWPQARMTSLHRTKAMRIVGLNEHIIADALIARRLVKGNWGETGDRKLGETGCSPDPKNAMARKQFRIRLRPSVI